MSNIKFKSNVSHVGILFKAGDIVSGLEDLVDNLVKRDLAELTTEAATHSSVQGDASGRALPVDPNASTEPTDAQIAAENAAREAELAKAAEASKRAAEAQVASAQPGVPTQAELEAIQ